MERGSDKHGPRVDDELKSQTEAIVRSGRLRQAEEWHDPEPPADDDPALGQGTGPED